MKRKEQQSENQMMDIHNHSVWSDGVNSITELVENAKANGIQVLGISDHYEMIKSIPDYLSEIKKIRKQYEGNIRILSGIEIAYTSIINCDTRQIRDFDYVLIEYISNANDILKASKALDEIKCPKILAHTDIKAIGTASSIDTAEVIRIIKQTSFAWEICTDYSLSFFDEVIFGEAKDLLELISESGIEIFVGSDTHDVQDYTLGRVKKANETASKYRLKAL